jgi:hypothetical protein
MRVLIGFVALLGFCLLLAALMFYPAASLLAHVSDLEPHRILTRLAKIIAALSFVYFLKRLDLWNRERLGYALPRREFVGDLLKGIVIGMAIMIVPVAILLLAEVGTPRETLPDALKLIQLVAGALASGLAVGFIEETFFRGALYGGMRRTTRLWTAALLSSAYYAALHFIKPRELPDEHVLGWLSGFPVLWSSLSPFGGTQIWDSFIALLGAGILLALIREYRGNIALAIGVHAGWVITIRFTKKLTHYNADAELAWLVGNYDKVIGWLATGWLVILILGYQLWQWRKQTAGG